MEKNILQSDSTISQIKQLSLENLPEQQQQRELVEKIIKEQQQFTLNNQKTTQNDYIQTLLDQLQTNLQLEISQDVYEEISLQRQGQKYYNDLKNVSEDEEHKLDEQEKLQEEEKLEEKESEGQQNKQFEQKNKSEDKIMDNKRIFEIIKVKKINDQKIQQQDNKQNDDYQTQQLFQELMNSIEKKVTQQQENESQQQKINQDIFIMLQQISTEQQQQLISALQQSPNNMILEVFSDKFCKTINIKESIQKYIQKENSLNILFNNAKQIKLQKIEQILNQKSKNGIESELTIKKCNIKKNDHDKQKRKDKIQNIFEENLIHQINNYVNNIYSFNDQVLSRNNNHFIDLFGNIEFLQNMIFPSLFKLNSEMKRLSIYIDTQKHPNLVFDSFLQMCKILPLPANMTEAIIQNDFKQQNQIQHSIKDSYKELIQIIVDTLIKFCDICKEEVLKRETIKETTQEYKKELREFDELLKQTQMQWIGVQQKYIEIQPIRDDQLDLIKTQLQHTDKDLLNKVNDQLKLRNFYLVSYLANGGEADILKGYQFIQNVIKQDCIFRCISIESEQFEEQKQEYDLVKSIQQPKNIIQYLDYIHLQDSNFVVFIAEKCKFSLWDEFKLFLSANMIEEFKLIQIVFDLIEGLIEMRIHKIVHGDIKPGNILITQKGYYVYSDFGLANIVEYDDIGIKNQGYSPSYSPPEQLNDENITYKSDIYSLGKSIIKLIDIIDKINCSEQIRNIGCVFKQLAEDDKVQDDPKQRYDCFEIFLKFQEKIFTNDYKRFLKVYLKKLELLIINNDFFLSQNLKSLKNFDYEYYQKTLYAYCILQIRITFFLNGTNINQQVLEESIQNNQFEDYNILNNEVAFSIGKIGDYFKIQNDQQQAMQCYKQQFNIYKILESSTEAIIPLNQISQCYISISKNNEGLQYLLEEYEICETIFQNNIDIRQCFERNISNICEAYPQQEKDLQNILEGLELLNQYKKQFSSDYILLLNKLIQIYNMKNDILNVLKYKIDIFQTRMEYQPKLGYLQIEKLMCDIIQLHDQYQKDYSNFIIDQLNLHVTNPNSDLNQKRLYLLHSHLGKYYYKNNNIESSLEQFQKAINISENKQQWNQNEQQEHIQQIKNCFIKLNKIEDFQLFILKYPHLKQEDESLIKKQIIIIPSEI